MTTPNSKTGFHVAVNLWSTTAYQFAAWYDLAGELRIGRIARGTSQRFGVDHVEYVVGGTPRTVLALPVAEDEHNFPSICVDGNGRIHVWANMHNNVVRYIRSTDPHTSGTWTGDSGWVDASTELPDRDDRNTYFTPVMFPDQSMMLYVRSGDENAGGPDPVSGQANSYVWYRTATGTAWTAGPGGSRVNLFQGLSVPEAGGPGVPGGDGTTAIDDRTNWSAYPSNFLVESARDRHPGRLHVCWVWRTEGVDGFSNQWPSYAYSDDKGVSWSAVDGAPLTVPITPLNSVAARTAPGAFVRSIGRDSNIVIANLDTANHGFAVGDTIHCRVVDTSYDGQFTVAVVGPGSGLTDTQIAWGQAAANDPAGGTGSVTKRRYVNWGNMAIDDQGLPHMLVSIDNPVYIRRNAANTAWVETEIPNPLGGIVHTSRWGGAFWWRGDLWGIAASQPNSKRRVRAFRVTNPGPVRMMSGGVGGDGSWDPSHDPEAWRLHWSMETLAPDGNRPQVFAYTPHRGVYRRA